MKQGRKSLDELTKALSDLSSRLENATLREIGNYTEDQEVGAKKAIEIQVFNQFKDGIHEELKPLVLASRTTTMEEALQIANSSNLDQPAMASVNNYKHQVKRFQNNNNINNYHNHHIMANYNRNNQSNNFNHSFNHNGNNQRNNQFKKSCDTYSTYTY